jgi:hypothetical protein
MRTLGRITVIAAVLTGMLAGAPTAAANDYECRVAAVGTPPEEITPIEGGEFDNIIVPSGWICVLLGVQVHGNVLAEPGSELFIEALFQEGGPPVESVIGGNVEVKEGASTGSFMANIGGNYKCDNCNFEDVVLTTVGGNVDVVGSDAGDFIIESTIGGDLHIAASDAGEFGFIVNQTMIGGDLIFEKNSGPVDISGNDIAGNLQIYENRVDTSSCPPANCGALLENGHFNDNAVGGNMQVFKNIGPTEINGNQVVQNLQCFDNVPAPVGEANVAGKTEGQCRALLGSPA